MATRYRVYEAPDGCGLTFCGECGMADTSPDIDGQEDEEPLSWHGAAGWHCVVRVKYDG